MSDSDSSSEDENLDLLKEATDTRFMKDSLYKSNGISNSKEEQEETVILEKLPSLRPQLDKEQQFNHLKVTPEFQNFVAKHLRKMIDKQLEESSVNMTAYDELNSDANNEISTGVRLFGSSSNYLSAETLIVPEKRKRHIPHKEKYVDNLEECKLAAVTSEWIISGEAVQGWQKSRRGEVIIVNKSGEIIKHERMKKKVKSNSWGVRNDSFHIDIEKNSLGNAKFFDKKEKMKEKRKKRREKKKQEKLENKSRFESDHKLNITQNSKFQLNGCV